MIDVTKLTPDQVEQYIHMQAIHDRQISAALRTVALREYYNGDHLTLLTQRQKEFLGALVADDTFPFSHNLCRSVIDTLAERLSVIGFDAGEEIEDATDPIWHWWMTNRLDILESDVHTAALRDGATYIMVGFDNEERRPRLTWHQLDDGTTGIVARHDPDNPLRLEMATRYWWQTVLSGQGTREVERKTVYLPAEIRKYKRGSAGLGWEPVQDDGDPSWPLPWVGSDGKPLGVAVVEFANPGGSEIGQIIGLQNALNKSWLDLIAAADASGFPILALEYPNGAPMGGDDDNDIDGANELNFAPGRAMEISGGTVKRIESANLTPMLDTIWAFVAAIAGVTRTPQYYLRPQGGGDVPSGESLKQLESGLVSRATKRQNVFGQAWADAMSLALRVNAAFGESVIVAPEAEITTKWQDAETRNEMTMAQVAEAHKRLNVPDEQVWMLLGYTPQEIDGFRAVLRSNQAANVAAIAAQMAAQRGTQNGGTNNPVQQNGGIANGGIAQRSQAIA